mmetsp:Transcript_28370/g.80084  ORF Transcript_28370/g.80084 Transcript_28370/m.80084 type:complete len:456 (+) Transcript_28370:1591-2958(+)
MLKLLLAYFLALRGRMAEAASSFLQYLEKHPALQPYISLIAAITYWSVGEEAAAERSLVTMKALLNMLPARVSLQAAGWVNESLDSPFWGTLSRPDALRDWLASVHTAEDPEAKPQAQEAVRTLPTVVIPEDNSMTAAELESLRPSHDAAVWIVRRPRAMGLPEFQDPSQGILIAMVPAKGCSVEEQLGSVVKDGPVIAQLVEEPARDLLKLGEVTVVGVRLYISVLQAEPLKAYIASSGLVFTIPSSQDDASAKDPLPPVAVVASGSGGDITPYGMSGIPDTADFIETGVLTIEEMKALWQEHHPEEQWGNFWDTCRSAAARVVLGGRLAEGLRESPGSFRPRNHDRLKVPKIIALDLGIGGSGSAPWVQQLQPYPSFAFPEGHPGIQVLAVVVADSWELVVEQARKTIVRRSSTAGKQENLDSWPHMAGRMKLLSECSTEQCTPSIATGQQEE